MVSDSVKILIESFISKYIRLSDILALFLIISML